MGREIVTSKQVLKYLKENLNFKQCVSVFIAGSVPEKLVPESDLDVMIVIKGRYKDEFLDNLKRIMDRFVEENKSVTYSFLKGPIKYKNKGLVHFILYSWEDHDKIGNKEQFKHEHLSMAYKLMQTEKTLYGKKINQMLNFNKVSKKDLKEDVKYFKEKYGDLRKAKFILSREWRKTKSGWKLVQFKRNLDPYTRSYLLKYVQKIK